MITMKEWMELVDYRITEGSPYCWQCFGDDAYCLSSWNGDQDGYSFSVVFDTKTQEVFVAEVCDYGRKRAYRLMNPDFKQAHDQEAERLSVNAQQAWDGFDFVDLEQVEDFLAKGRAIQEGTEYDTRVCVSLTLPDDLLFVLMKKAHDQDITLNQLVEQILTTEIHRIEQEQAHDRA
jgi:predicted HicB family RNase H-like nuclease